MDLESEEVLPVPAESFASHVCELADSMEKQVHQAREDKTSNNRDGVTERKLRDGEIAMESIEMEIEIGNVVGRRKVKDKPHWKSVSHLTGDATIHLETWRKGILEQLRKEKQAVEYWGTTKSRNFARLLSDCAEHKTRVAVIKEVKPDVLREFLLKELKDYYHHLNE